MAIPSIIIGGVNIVTFAIGLGNFFALYLAISLSLNLEGGYTGIPNFGKVMFIAGGAAVSGAISGRLAALILGINTHGDYISFNPQVISSINAFLTNHLGFAIALLLFSVLLAAGVGATLGYLVSYPAIRLREDYLGMLLLASAQFFQIFLSGFEPLVGGTQGIGVPDPYAAWANAGPGVRDTVALGVISLFAILVYVYVERVARSPLGRTLRAVRDSEEASRALGKDDVAVRKKVLIIASAISGMAGALVTFYAGSVGADTWVRFSWTFWPWVMLIMGGAANNVGVALGAFAFIFILKVIEQVKFFFQPYLPFNVNWIEYFVFAGMLIVILMVKPEGIIREKPTMTIRRSWINAVMKGGTALGEKEGTLQAPVQRSRVGRLLQKIRLRVRTSGSE